MALRLAFIGYSEHMTRYYFREFVEANRDQILGYSITGGGALFADGTQVFIAPSIDRLYGRRIDQVIVVCDSRGTWLWPRHRRELLSALEERALLSSQVPEEDIIITYNLDEREA